MREDDERHEVVAVERQGARLLQHRGQGTEHGTDHHSEEGKQAGQVIRHTGSIHGRAECERQHDGQG